MAQNFLSSSDSQRLNLTVAVIAAVFCLSPLFVLTIQKRYVSDDGISAQHLMEAISQSRSSQLSSLFVILIPAADLFLDFPFSQRNLKSSKNSDRNSVIFVLNDIGRLIFIIGVAIQSCVWFCPVSTDSETLGLVYDTTTNASVLLVLFPILTYLQRCTTTFSSFRASGLVMLTSLGLVFLTTGNFFQYDCIGRRTVVYLGWGVLGLSIFYYFSLIGFCAFKYLHTNLRTSIDRKAFLAQLINLFRRSVPGIEDKQRTENVHEVYSNYIPALHMTASVILIVAYFCIKFLDGYDHATVYELRTYIVIACEVVVLVIELRIRKNEVARALVRKCDSSPITLILPRQAKSKYDTIILHSSRSPCWSPRNRTYATFRTNCAPHSTQHSWDSNCSAAT
jgi:hypothetical protein